MILEHIIKLYLTYRDVEQLRNCCTYLHNFTRDMRMQWQLAPPPRDLMINMVLHLFVQWSRVDDEGAYAPDFQLEDQHGQPVCERHLLLQCGDPHCRNSHAPILYSREDLASIGAYITHDDFMFFISKVFGPKFVWRNEVYINVLFDAFGVERLVAGRSDPMTRRNEVVRQRDYRMEKYDPSVHLPPNYASLQLYSHAAAIIAAVIAHAADATAIIIAALFVLLLLLQLLLAVAIVAIVIAGVVADAIDCSSCG